MLATRLGVQFVLPALLALEIHGKTAERRSEVKVAQLAQGLLAACTIRSIWGRVAFLGGTLARAVTSDPQHPSRWENLISIPGFVLSSLAFMRLAPRLGPRAFTGPAMATLVTVLGLWSRYAKPSPGESDPVALPDNTQVFKMGHPGDNQYVFDLVDYEAGGPPAQNPAYQG